MNRMNKSMRIIGTAAALVCVSVMLLDAQRPAPKPLPVPDTHSKASSATPRLPDGQPDLNGQWYHRFGPPAPQIKPGESYNLPIGFPFQHPVGFPKYKPEYQAKVKDLAERQIDVDPAWFCGPPGVPRIGPPQKIVQTAKEIVFLYDDLSANFFRVVRMNGKHRENLEVSAHGDSVGHWEDDTLVVDVRNLDDTTWLTDNGAIHSDQTRIVERLRRDGNTLHYEATVYDPVYFAEPWKVNGRVLPLMTNYEIEEAPLCIERDRPNIPDLGYHGNIR